MLAPLLGVFRHELVLYRFVGRQGRLGNVLSCVLQFGRNIMLRCCCIYLRSHQSLPFKAILNRVNRTVFSLKIVVLEGNQHIVNHDVLQG